VTSRQRSPTRISDPRAARPAAAGERARTVQNRVGNNTGLWRPLSSTARTPKNTLSLQKCGNHTFPRCNPAGPPQRVSGRRLSKSGAPGACVIWPAPTTCLSFRLIATRYTFCTRRRDTSATRPGFRQGDSQCARRHRVAVRWGAGRRRQRESCVKTRATTAQRTVGSVPAVSCAVPLGHVRKGGRVIDAAGGLDMAAMPCLTRLTWRGVP
jgi:hypothetical protein